MKLAKGATVAAFLSTPRMTASVLGVVMPGKLGNSCMSKSLNFCILCTGHVTVILWLSILNPRNSMTCDTNLTYLSSAMHGGLWSSSWYPRSVYAILRLLVMTLCALVCMEAIALSSTYMNCGVGTAGSTP